MTVPEIRYPWEKANAVAEEICARLRPGCVRIKIAGSLRRQRPDVGDIEILYIPFLRESENPKEFFVGEMADCAEVQIRSMCASGILERRLNSLGRETYGPLNKLMRHVGSGIPVDLFGATGENWYNYLVCRTGPAGLNASICVAAQRKGWKWNPYGAGFSNAAGELRVMNSEAAVFAFVGIPYRDPPQRGLA